MQIPQINSVARLYALFLGGVLLVVGLLGWVPALTPHGAFLGVFGVSPLHNIAHILTGAIGVVAGLLISDSSARFYTAMMCLIYGVLALLGFLQVALLQQTLAVNLPDNLLHTAIFVLSLLVYLSAIFEQRALERLADHAQAAASNQLALSTANYAAPAQAGPAEQLDFAQMIRNRWDSVRRTPNAGANQQMAASGVYPGGANDTVRALAEQVAYLEGQVRDLKQQMERLLLLEWDVTQLKNERGLSSPQLGQLPSGSPSRVPARPGIPSMPNAQSYRPGDNQQGGWPPALNAPQPPQPPRNPVAPLRPPAPDIYSPDNSGRNGPYGPSNADNQGFQGGLRPNNLNSTSSWPADDSFDQEGQGGWPSR